MEVSFVVYVRQTESIPPTDASSHGENLPIRMVNINPMNGKI